MIEKVNRNNCVGCKACAMICPVNAIFFERNSEGYEYPIVKRNECINCKKCLIICPTYECQKEKLFKKEYYVGRIKNEDILLKSSSGGIFFGLAECIIKKNGVVYGVQLNNENKVVYNRADTIEQVEAMRGSKYVEAFISLETIEQLVNDVKNKVKVLFSGTPCQIAGMKRIILERNIDDSNVLWVDFFVCSGKVSTYLWNDEIKKLSEEGIISEVNFRDKISGWENYSFSYKCDGNTRKQDFLTARWSKFLGNVSCIRRSCIKCGYDSGDNDYSDISLGDYWYSKADLPRAWKDNKGISIITVNSEVGENALRESLEIMDIITIPSFKVNDKHNDIVDENERDTFWTLYNEKGYDELIKKYANITQKEKVLFGIVRPVLINLHLLDIFRKRINNEKND